MAKALTPYVSADLGNFEADSDQAGQRGEGDFKANKSMAEGIGGRLPMDTTFENTSEVIVQDPRSEWDDNISLRGMSVKDSTNRKPAPNPMDLHRYPHRRV